MVSPITAWEIGILVSRGRIALSREPNGRFQALIEAGVALAPTARAMNYRLMTRDQRRLDFAAAGRLTVVAC